KLEAMERRIKTLEAQLKDKPPRAAKPAAAAPGDATRANAAGGNAPDTSTAASNLSTSTARALRALAEAKPSSEPAADGKDGRKPIFGVLDSPVAGLSIGAYGEVAFGTQQNPAANGQWQNGFDAHRLVLLPTYAITSNIIFNAEIEFEHAGAAFDTDDKLHGTAEIEQMWIDFKLSDPVNWRSPGIDLIPIGWINQHHEPTLFYSVNRPELYNGLLPSTWKAPATSVYGKIVDGLS